MSEPDPHRTVVSNSVDRDRPVKQVGVAGQPVTEVIVSAELSLLTLWGWNAVAIDFYPLRLHLVTISILPGPALREQ